MPVEKRIEKRWEYTLTTTNGVTMKASGPEGAGDIQIEIHEPSQGYGMNETPGSRGIITVSTLDFDEWAELIRKSTVLKVLPEALIHAYPVDTHGGR